MRNDVLVHVSQLKLHTGEYCSLHDSVMRSTMSFMIRSPILLCEVYEVNFLLFHNIISTETLQFRIK
jgi:hypothetical protein